MLNFLEGFRHQASRWITGVTVEHVAGGEWEYNLVVATLEAAGLHPIQEYIWIQQANIVSHVECRPIC